MIGIVKFLLFLFVAFLVVMLIRIIIGVVKFLRLLRRLPKQEEAAGRGPQKARSHGGSRGKKGDSETIELGKDDYKVE